MDNKKIKLNIGLDIGIASVGWAILKDNNEILDMGVRLFNDAANPDNGGSIAAKRREYRSIRRRLRRVKNRKKTFIQLLVKHNIVKTRDEAIAIINKKINQKELEDTISQDEKFYRVIDGKKENLSIVGAKVMGLEHKLPKKLLIYILFQYLKHRGIFFKLDDEKPEKPEKHDKNHESYQIDNKKFPSENQLEFYKKFGYWVGANFSAPFRASDWLREIEHLFKCQSKHNVLEQNFCKEYKNFFDPKEGIRPYNLGPGGENSPTIWGLYRENKENKKVEKVKDKAGKECKNLWDITVGTCAIYPYEQKGGKNSPKAEIFNFLDQLNTFYTIDKNHSISKLAHNLKEKIIDNISEEILKKISPNEDKEIEKEKKQNFILSKNNISFSNIVKYIKKNNENAETVEGFRAESASSTELNLNNLVIIAGLLYECKYIGDDFNILKNWDHVSLINEIFNCAWKSQTDEQRVEEISNFLRIKKLNIKKDRVEDLVKNLKKVKGTHAYSYAYMDEYINKIGIKKSRNSEEYLKDTNRRVHYNYDEMEKKFKNGKYLDKTMLNNLYGVSPTVRRAFVQTIRVLNKILEIYLFSKNNEGKYEINNIVIEMAREKNSYAQKKEIDEWQKRNKTLIKKIVEKTKNPILINQNENKEINKNYDLKIALKLAHEQNWIDLYDGKQINEKNFHNEYNTIYETDHIIPKSRFYDNSMMNLTLTKKANNKEKMERTPHEWLSNNKDDYEKFEKRLDNLLKSKKDSGLKGKELEKFRIKIDKYYKNKDHDFFWFY